MNVKPDRRAHGAAVGGGLERVKPTAVQAGLEATGPYSEGLAAFVHQSGYTLSVVNFADPFPPTTATGSP
jgi:transposase